MPLDLQAVKDSQALQIALAKIDLTIPSRVERKTHQTELWTACRLLSTLAHHGLLRFPLSVRSRDRPDILATLDGREVGIEITEAIVEQSAEFSALAEREFPGAAIEYGHFRFGGRKFSVDEMRAILASRRLTAPPWLGDEPEREWAKSIQSRIEAKVRKFAKVGFTKFDQSWLAVYDNLALPALKLERAVAMIMPLLETGWEIHPMFDKIFVEHRSVIVEMTPQGARYLPLNDLWRSSPIDALSE